MKISTLIPAAFVTVLSGSALAGGFVGIGLGSPSNIQDDTGRFSADGRSGRIFGGYSRPVLTGRVAGEAGYLGFGLLRGNATQFDGRMLWLAARYNHPLQSGIEIFGRLGVQNTNLSQAENGSYEISGTGPLVGLGFEYHPPLKLGVDAAVYVDLGYASASADITDSRGTMFTTEISDHFVSLGLVVGF